MLDLTLKEVLQDALICEKFMASMYEQYMKESSNMQLLDLLTDNFEEILEIQHNLFVEMKDRDMYPVENAPKQKIEQALTMLKQSKKTYERDFNKK